MAPWLSRLEVCAVAPRNGRSDGRGGGPMSIVKLS
jgi:hypothetical protein